MRTARHLHLALLLGGLSGAAVLLGSPQPAQAHAIESSLARVASLNDQWLLQSHFGNGEPVDAAVVRLIPPTGEPIVVGRTDASGQLRFQLPHQAKADWELQVDRGAGHRDYLELPAAGHRTQAHQPGPGLFQARSVPEPAPAAARRR